MTRRYFVQGALAMGVLFLVGCSKSNKDDEGGKTVSAGPKTAGVPDKDDFVDEEKDYHGDWDAAKPIDVTNAVLAQYQHTAYGQPDFGYMQALENAVRIGETYGTRNGGRQAFRLIPAFGVGRWAVVVFSDNRRKGYRVKLGRASRVNSGADRGFVFKNGSIGGYFAHSPYGRNPRQIIVYY